MKAQLPALTPFGVQQLHRSSLVEDLIAFHFRPVVWLFQRSTPKARNRASHQVGVALLPSGARHAHDELRQSSYIGHGNVSMLTIHGHIEHVRLVSNELATPNMDRLRSFQQKGRCEL